MSTSLQFADHRVEAVRFADDFLLLRAAQPDVLRRIGTALYRRNFAFVDEVIVTGAEVLVKFNDRYAGEDLGVLTAIELDAEAVARRFVLPVLFEAHADWEAVRTHSGMDREAVIAALCSREFTVAMLGFLPGFAYLEGLPEQLHVPRKAVPAKYVAAGSLAIGGKYLGLYALDSPGGWHVLGRTPLRVLEVPALPPVPYVPGDHVCLQAIDPERFAALQARALTFADYQNESDAHT